MGNYILYVINTELRFGANERIGVKVKIDCRVHSIISEETSQSSFQYLIGSPKITFKLPDYSLGPTGCIKPIEFTLFMIEIDGQTMSNPILPSFIQFDKIKKEITIYGTNVLEGQKSYKFLVAAREPLSGVTDKQPWQFTVNVSINNRPPEFLSPLQDIVLTSADLQSG